MLRTCYTIVFMIIRQRLIKLGDLFYYKTLEQALSNIESVLDVGCGGNSPLSRIKKKFYSVGVDIFRPSIKKSKRVKIHDEYKLGNILKINAFFKPKSFDAVIALDVIEHLEKKDGLKLLKDMESIAKKKVIVLTPYGFTKQNPYEDNPHQVHKSGWAISDFQKLGYKVYGMRGLRFIRGECATIKYKPWFFWGTISMLSQFFVYFFPKLAYQLFAVKEIKK